MLRTVTLFTVTALYKLFYKKQTHKKLATEVLHYIQRQECTLKYRKYFDRKTNIEDCVYQTKVNYTSIHLHILEL